MTTKTPRGVAGCGRFTPPRRGAAAERTRPRRLAGAVSAGILATAGLGAVGIGVLEMGATPAFAVVCNSGTPTATDGSGNACTTTGAGSTATSGEPTLSILINESSPLNDNHLTVDVTATNNLASAAEGFAAAAGSDSLQDISLDATAGVENFVTLLTNDNFNGNTAVADGGNADAGSGNLIIEDFTGTASGTLTLHITSNLTADNNSAVVVGSGTAIAGSGNVVIQAQTVTGTDTDTTVHANITTDSNSALAEGGSATAGSENVSLGGSVVANGNTATANGAGSTAEAGSDNDNTDGTVVANDNTAIANGAGSTAEAGSNNFGTGGTLVVSHNTAIATSAGGGSATAIAG